VRVVLPGMSGPGFAHHRVGEVDVLTVSDRLAPAGDSSKGLTAFRTTRFLARHRVWLTFGWVAFCALAMFGPEFLGPRGASATSLLMGGSVLVGWSSARAAREAFRRRRLRLALTWAVPALVGFAGLVAFARAANTWWDPGFTVLMVALMFFGFYLVDQVFVPFAARSTDGRRRVLTPKLRQGMVLVSTGTPPGLAVVVVGEGIRFEADALHRVFGALSGDVMELASAAEVELGWTLLRMHADLSGLLRGLAQVRPDDGGRHPWADLPRAWQLAYMFGLVEAMGSATDREALRTQVREASEVAAIAERLDLEQRE